MPSRLWVQTKASSVSPHHQQTRTDENASRFHLAQRCRWSEPERVPSVVQHDNMSELIGINSRLHWIPEAGREMYRVFNQSRRWECRRLR
jgi:hypothetical protein